MLLEGDDFSKAIDACFVTTRLWVYRISKCDEQQNENEKPNF
jgi:flagellar biosynthesis regulator FlaF